VGVGGIGGLSPASIVSNLDICTPVLNLISKIRRLSQ
jgi:hypothetical protein